MFWKPKMRPPVEPPNPNLLNVHQSVIYEAIEHPFPPERPLGKAIPRDDDEKFGKPKPIIIKNLGIRPKKEKKVKVKQMTHEEWVAAGKPVWDEEKAIAEAEAEEEASKHNAERMGMEIRELRFKKRRAVEREQYMLAAELQREIKEIEDALHAG